VADPARPSICLGARSEGFVESLVARSRPTALLAGHLSVAEASCVSRQTVRRLIDDLRVATYAVQLDANIEKSELRTGAVGHVWVTTVRVRERR
jgi:hypothetical protein